LVNRIADPMARQRLLELSALMNAELNRCKAPDALRLIQK